jgi:hypothetical protein
VFDFTTLLRPLQGLKARAGALREQLATLTAERNRIQHAPAARADVNAMIVRWIDNKAAGFAASFTAAVNEFVRRPQTMQGDLRVNQVLSLTGAANGGEELAAGAIDRALCALMGPQIKQALISALDTQEWPQEGLPLAARAQELARIDQQIEKLQRELDTLSQQAADAGIVL